MRGKKTHTRDKVKIIKAKLEDPERSLRDIQKETGSPKDTVSRAIKEVGEVATTCDNGRLMIEKLHSIVDDIINIQKKSLKKFIKIADSEEGLSTKEVKDLSDVGKTNWERAMVLEGKPTDITKVDFNLEGKSIKELESLRQQILSSKSK